jgi:nitric oxide reductase large subunit
MTAVIDYTGGYPYKQGIKKAEAAWSFSFWLILLLVRSVREDRTDFILLTFW